MSVTASQIEKDWKYHETRTYDNILIFQTQAGETSIWKYFYFVLSW